MDTQARLAAALAAHERTVHPALPGRTNHLGAGVLVALRTTSGLEVVITERTKHLSNHPGELCFPGGRPDPQDADLLSTAIRETREEVGVAPAKVLGALSSVPLYTSDHRLHPFVGLLAPGDEPAITSPDEVATIHLLSIEALLDRAFHDAIPFRIPGMDALMPVFQVGPGFIFGGTAAVLYELLIVSAKALDRRLPPLEAGRYDWSDVMPSLGP